MTRWLQAAKQDAAPRTKLTEPTKPKAGEIEGGADTTGSEVLSVLSVLSARECAGLASGQALTVPYPTNGPLIPIEHISVDALDAFEERAAIREYDGGQTRAMAEAVALAEAAQACGRTPEALRRLWADHPDACAYLAHLTRHGPVLCSVAAKALGWDAMRAWQAEARLRAVGLVEIRDGRAWVMSGGRHARR